MTASGGNQLISVQPDELKFIVEVDKQSYCDLRVANNTEHYVAFKVKTTSPKKYFVRPNTGVVQPWDSCIIRVTLQAQREYPPDMQCRDKFLLQSTTVAPHTDVDELPQDIFNKDSGRRVEESKLKVSYVSPTSVQGNSEYGSSKNAGQSQETISTIQRLKEERDAAVQQTQQLQQDLDMLKKRRNLKNDPGFSFKFAAIIGLIGIILGFILNLSFSSSSPASGELLNSVHDLKK